METTTKVVEKTFISLEKVSVGDMEVTATEVKTRCRCEYKLCKSNGELSQKLIAKTPLEERKKSVTFPLEEVTADEIQKRREKKKATIVVKKEGKLLAGDIPKRISLQKEAFESFPGFEGKEHLCAYGNAVCARLSVLDDPKGCQKVRDLDPERRERDFPWVNPRSVKKIEKYSWITVGVETFGVHYPQFLVMKCKNFKETATCIKKSVRTTDMK